MHSCIGLVVRGECVAEVGRPAVGDFSPFEFNSWQQQYKAIYMIGKRVFNTDLNGATFIHV